MGDMEQFLHPDSVSKANEISALELQLKESKVLSNCVKEKEKNTFYVLFTIIFCVCFFFQGVLDDIQTLQLNVTNVNACLESVKLKLCDDVTKDQMQDDVTKLNQRYMIN